MDCSSRFFSLAGPAAPFLLDGAKRTDLFIDADQILTELLETMKLGDFSLSLAKCDGVGKGFRHGLAGYPPSEAELGIMVRIVWLSSTLSNFGLASSGGR